MFAHPEDPRVAIVSSRDEFVDAARGTEYATALCPRPFGERHDECQGVFKAIWDRATLAGAELHPQDPEQAKAFRNRLLKAHFHARANSSGGIGFVTYPQIYEPAEDFVREMARLYADTTVYNSMIGKLFPDLRTLKGHIHLYPVLNWALINKGANWKDKNGTDQCVPEGACMLLPPRFRHGSTLGTRLTGTIGPDWIEHLRAD